MTPSEKKLHRPRRDVRPHVHTFSRTSPSEIDVHINELVLHGFEGRNQRTVAEALRNQLSALLTEQGIPATWKDNPETLQARATYAIGLTNPTTAGTEIAKAIYHSDQPKGGNSHHPKRGVERI